MYKKVFLITITMFFSSVSFAGIVFDPANFMKNTITATQTFQTAENTLNTYNTVKDTYGEVVNQYELTETNLEELPNVNQLISDLNSTVNGYYGTSPMSQLANLDPNSANYAEQRDAILAKYYQKPADPNLIQAEFQGVLNQNQIEAMMAEAQLQNLNFQSLQDTVDQSTHEQAKATQRANDIATLGQTIEGLGANSELKTQQTTASEVNFQLQQNEQLIQNENEALKYQRMQKAEVDSEKAKESQAEQASLQKAINQGTTGLGRDKWGDV